MKIILTVLISFITVLSFAQEDKAKKELSDKEQTEQQILKNRKNSKVTKGTTLKDAARLKSNPKAKAMQDYLNKNVKRKSKMLTKTAVAKKDLNEQTGVEHKPKPNGAIKILKKENKQGRKDFGTRDSEKLTTKRTVKKDLKREKSLK